MANKYYTILTDVGAAKIAEAPIYGHKVVIKDFAVGDGMGGYYEPTQEQTALKNEVYRGQIDDYSTEGNKIKIKGIIPATAGGFTVHEIGVFDDSGDLIAVANTANSEKPLPLDGIAYKMEVGITISINGQPDCVIEIDDLSTAKLKKLISDTRREIINNLDPPGTVKKYAGNGAIPGGYLLCNGAAISRNTYGALFETIGTTYGDGDGVSTFNLPDVTARFIEGSDTAGEIKAPGLPEITASLQNTANEVSCFVDARVSGAFAMSTSQKRQYAEAKAAGETKYNDTVTFAASRANAIYGNSDTVQPAALTMRYIIRY